MLLGSTPPIFESGRKTSTASSGLTSSINDPNFMQLLITQMQNPDLGSLFAGPEEESTSPFGNTFDIFGSSSQNLLSGVNQLSGATGLYGAFGQTPLMSGLTPQMELSIWSGLIGKTITALEGVSGQTVSGKIESVNLEQGVVKLKIGDNLVDPNALESIQIK